MLKWYFHHVKTFLHKLNTTQVAIIIRMLHINKIGSVKDNIQIYETLSMYNVQPCKIEKRHSSDADTSFLVFTIYFLNEKLVLI